MQARDLYRLLVEDSAPVRHAAADLVAGMLEPQGRHFLAQVRLQLLLTKLLLACRALSRAPFRPKQGSPAAVAWD